MDDVKFGHNGPYGDAWKAESLTYYHYRRCDTGTESDVYECLVFVVKHWHTTGWHQKYDTDYTNTKLSSNGNSTLRGV